MTVLLTCSRGVCFQQQLASCRSTMIRSQRKRREPILGLGNNRIVSCCSVCGSFRRYGGGGSSFCLQQERYHCCFVVASCTVQQVEAMHVLQAT
jgi:hypothetical protein